MANPCLPEFRESSSASLIPIYNKTDPLSEMSSIVSVADQRVLLSRIDDATKSICKLEERSLELRKSGDSNGAMAAWEQSLALDRQVRELNGKSSSFTRYDLISMRRIFEPPINEYHIDKDGTHYYAPDYSEILRFLESYRVPGGYVGYGMNPRNKAVDPATGKLRLCDFIYMTKGEDQISFEKEEFNPLGDLSDALSQFLAKVKLDKIFWKSGYSKIKERIEAQAKIAKYKFLPFLKANIARWRYDGYLLCLTPKDFENLGGTLEFSSDQLYKTHAVTLFYKEAPEKVGL